MKLSLQLKVFTKFAKTKKMKIVILDGFTANPGDLEWHRLSDIGTLTVYERTLPENVVDRCEEAEIVLTNKTVISGDTLRKLPNLKYIGVLATGYNVVDIATAESLGIIVTNVPSYSTMSVAQNVFALILEITNSVGHYTEEVKKGRWSESKDFCFTDTFLSELSGKQMGIVGYGAIGSKVALIAAAFGMTVAAYTSKSEHQIAPVLKMELDDLFKTSDIISLHCPLTNKTRHLVNRERIAIMKKSAILINTGRGPLIDEKALAEALREKRIFAAGVDVLTQEPPEKDNPLIKAPHIFITPHISWATFEARKRLLAVAIENVECFVAGKPRNVVTDN